MWSVKGPNARLDRNTCLLSVWSRGSAEAYAHPPPKSSTDAQSPRRWRCISCSHSDDTYRCSCFDSKLVLNTLPSPFRFQLNRSTTCLLTACPIKAELPFPVGGTPRAASNRKKFKLDKMMHLRSLTEVANVIRERVQRQDLPSRGSRYVLGSRDEKATSPIRQAMFFNISILCCRPICPKVVSLCHPSKHTSR